VLLPQPGIDLRQRRREGESDDQEEGQAAD
jgi:hypothetical protein